MVIIDYGRYTPDMKKKHMHTLNYPPEIAKK